MNQGEIVLIADSQGVRDIYSADGTAIEPTAPLTVLVNKGTASASEVCDMYNRIFNCICLALTMRLHFDQPVTNIQYKHCHHAVHQGWHCLLFTCSV
jgi:hypothetical protein